MPVNVLEVRDPSFARLVPAAATLEKLAGGLDFTEGPVWLDGALVFSDIPASELKRWTRRDGMTTFRAPSDHANGNTLDRQGRLVTCEHGTRRVTRTERDGRVTVLADRFEGKRFNSPNDVVVKSDGSVWFTDPPYGLPVGERRELEKNYVFRLDPDRRDIRIVASDFDMPNGLCFSPDEKRLYIADSGQPHHVRCYDVKSDGSLAGGAVFCAIHPGVPDGMRCDEHGNLWSTAGDGLHVFSLNGKLLGKILFPETPSNCCLGGDDGKTLFVTARTSVYAIETSVRGAG